MKLNSILGSGATAFVNAVRSNNKSEHYEKAMKANNGQISFREDIHEYRNVQSKEVYISVTTIIGQFQKKFHNEYWSLYKALEVSTTDKLEATLKVIILDITDDILEKDKNIYFV